MLASMNDERAHQCACGPARGQEALPWLLLAVWWLAPGRSLMTAPTWPMDRSLEQASRRASSPDLEGWVARALGGLHFQCSLAKGAYAPETRAAVARLQARGALLPGGQGCWRLHPQWWEAARDVLESVLPADASLLTDLALTWAGNSQRQRERAVARRQDIRATGLRTTDAAGQQA